MVLGTRLERWNLGDRIVPVLEREVDDVTNAPVREVQHDDNSPSTRLLICKTIGHDILSATSCSPLADRRIEQRHLTYISATESMYENEKY